MARFPAGRWPRTLGMFVIFAALVVGVLLLVRAAAPDRPRGLMHGRALNGPVARLGGDDAT